MSTADEAVRTASTLALNEAIGRAAALATQFVGGKEVIKIGNQLLVPREVAQVVYLTTSLFFNYCIITMNSSDYL